MISILRRNQRHSPSYRRMRTFQAFFLPKFLIRSDKEPLRETRGSKKAAKNLQTPPQ